MLTIYPCEPQDNQKKPLWNVSAPKNSILIFPYSRPTYHFGKQKLSALVYDMM